MLLRAGRRLETVFGQFNPGYPFEYKFLDDAYEETYRSELVMGRLANAFAIVAILVSCLGLFGLSSFAAEQRRKEIGVRKVLGSSVPALVVLLSMDFTRLHRDAADRTAFGELSGGAGGGGGSDKEPAV